MKKLSILVLLILLVSLTIYAGQAYGNIQENGHPIQEGTEVKITCSGKEFVGRTNRDGDYRIYVGEKGQCILSIVRNKQPVTFEINSYTNPVHYDFDLVIENGHYLLRRR